MHRTSNSNVISNYLASCVLKAIMTSRQVRVAPLWLASAYIREIVNLYRFCVTVTWRMYALTKTIIRLSHDARRIHGDEWNSMNVLLSVSSILRRISAWDDDDDDESLRYDGYVKQYGWPNWRVLLFVSCSLRLVPCTTYGLILYCIVLYFTVTEMSYAVCRHRIVGYMGCVDLLMFDCVFVMPITRLCYRLFRRSEPFRSQLERVCAAGTWLLLHRAPQLTR